MSPPVNVTGWPEVQQPRRQVCAVTACKHSARTDGRCWSHRVDPARLRAVALLAAGVDDIDLIMADTGLSAPVVMELAGDVRDLLEGG